VVMVVKKAKVVVVVVVVMAVADWKSVVLAQSMHAHTHMSGQKHWSYRCW